MVYAQPLNLSGRMKRTKGFEIQTDHQISVRRPDLVIVRKKGTRQIENFVVPADHRGKTERKRNDRLVPRPC